MPPPRSQPSQSHKRRGCCRYATGTLTPLHRHLCRELASNRVVRETPASDSAADAIVGLSGYENRSGNRANLFMSFFITFIWHTSSERPADQASHDCALVLRIG